MPNTWFTGDSHFGHKNMVKGVSTWPDKSVCRDFPTIEEMNDQLVLGINSVVRPDDVLYHLGDWNFGGLKNMREFRDRIHCESIHLILGNHDFNHNQIPPSSVAHNFSSVVPYREIVINGREIVLCHYAMRVWNNQSKGSWHLYGHSHGTLPRLHNFSLDIGVEGDVSSGKFNPVPVNFLDLFGVFENDKIKNLDHHTRNTQSVPFTR